ncbi:MAG TPA: hypothetical protein VEI55_00340 [Candidatus Acidoferrum sp.]|nr:hypothetical protein [Candidatus Acidoferrum sp.]
MKRKTRKAERRVGSEAGFSILELMMVTVITFIACGFAIMRLQPAWQQLQANTAMSQMKSSLRQARETAISQRRTILVQFVKAIVGTPCAPAGNVTTCVVLTQMVVTAGTPNTQAPAAAPFAIIPLESNVQLLSFAGEPDTPDAFIGQAPNAPNGLYSAGAAQAVPTALGALQFQSDGTFTNGAVNPINFTIFLGEPNIPSTARAITVMGNTGKVTGYAGSGSAWFR